MKVHYSPRSRRHRARSRRGAKERAQAARRQKRLAPREREGRRLAVGLAGAQHRAWEIAVVDGVREELRFKAAAAIDRVFPSVETRDLNVHADAIVELHAGLGRRDVEGDA